MDGGPVIDPGPPPAAAQPPDAGALEGFLASCEQNAEVWTQGEARYPPTLMVELGGTATYSAGVAIDDGEILRAQLPAAEGFAPVPVDVSCGLSARLTSQDGSIAIDATGESTDADSSGWILLPFAQPGQVQWSWSITAREPGEHQLLLELQPAVALGDGRYYPQEGATVPRITRVDVEATVLQVVSAWWEEYWDTVATIGAAVGAAIIGVITWLRNVGRAIRGKEPSDETTDEPADAGAAPAPPKPPADD